MIPSPRDRRRFCEAVCAELGIAAAADPATFAVQLIRELRAERDRYAARALTDDEELALIEWADSDTTGFGPSFSAALRVARDVRLRVPRKR